MMVHEKTGFARFFLFLEQQFDHLSYHTGQAGP
jgi:hypothetical protein